MKFFENSALFFEIRYRHVLLHKIKLPSKKIFDFDDVFVIQCHWIKRL